VWVKEVPRVLDASKEKEGVMLLLRLLCFIFNWRLIE